MKIQSLVVAAAIVLISGSAFAGKDSTIVLNNGEMTPASPVLKLDTSKLVQNISYDVSCDIVDATNPNSTNATFSVVTGGGLSGATFDGVSQQGSYQFDLKPAFNPNTLVLHGVTNNGSYGITLTSADQTDTLVASNCIAHTP